MLKNSPLPTRTLDSWPSWDSAHGRALKIQKCDACGEFRFYATPICHFCGSDTFTWTPVSGQGTVYTWTELHRARGNPFENDVPIAIVLVELAEGVVLMSNLIDYAPEDLRIGLPVTLAYEDISDEFTLPVFRPARSATT